MKVHEAISILNLPQNYTQQELKKKYYIIDGRTRFYCCLFLNVPAKVRIICDYEIRS